MRKLMIFCVVFLACSSRPDPKDTVFAFIEAVMVSDSLGVIKNLDIDTYVTARMAEMSPEDSAIVLAESRDKTIRSLLGEGPTRLRWMNQQILVNESFESDSTAEVEVSFIDRTIDHMVYTKMQLKLQPDNSWKIVYFQ
ncbi:MAG: hypothetical protein V3W18_11440 [candidate division Zixibacteria bacterium]